MTINVSDQPRVSVIVPVLHDVEALGELMQQLTNCSPMPSEVIVVDAGSHDISDIAVDKLFDLVVTTSPPGRGVQLNAGAKRANGDLFWFLHADAKPSSESIAKIVAAVDAGSASGCFRFRFAGQRRWFVPLLEWLINWRARLGTPYGDQGIFADRQHFFAAQGFAEQPLFEEVRLVRRLRKSGDFTQLDTPIGVNPRRWERDGWLRRSLHNRLLALGHILGIPSRVLARHYANMNEAD